AGGPATPTSDAARAGATTIIALTIKLDPSVGADHVRVLNFENIPCSERRSEQLKHTGRNQPPANAPVNEPCPDRGHRLRSAGEQVLRNGNDWENEHEQQNNEQLHRSSSERISSHAAADQLSATA
ncbi:hypothetical protein, partial [Chelativorans composti]|uniref:hypothetical protein n=1 Tax=Chelativorans composti TaxID=768533 RepID=UPI0031E9FDD1